jgi:N-acyl-phosphatidylethanolamine-hydrolysing phospholipase D
MALRALMAASVYKGFSPAATALADTTASPARKNAAGLSLEEMAARRVHHGNGRFHNPFSDRPHGGFGRLLKWKLFSKNRFRRFYDQEPVTPVTVDWPSVDAAPGVSVTLLRHATLVIKDVNAYILVDPVFFGLPGMIQDFSPLDFDPEKIPAPRHILITHGHYDHLDKQSLGSMDPGTHVITPLGYEPVLEDLNLSNHREMDWFDGYEEEGCRITLLPCNHWTMRNPLVGPNRALWGSYLIRTAGGPTVYVSGDTGYFDGFKEIGRKYDIDLAVVNLGAYEPRWFMKTAHMNPAETVRAFRELGARRLMIAHWGTFRLGDEPVHFPPRDIRREMARQGLEHCLADLGLGQTLFMNA